MGPHIVASTRTSADEVATIITHALDHSRAVSVVADDASALFEAAPSLLEHCDQISLIGPPRSQEQSGNLKTEHLEDRVLAASDLIVVSECDGEILREVLFLARPHTTIVVLASGRGSLEEVDLYSTVHFKNLKLKFLPAASSGD